MSGLERWASLQDAAVKSGMAALAEERRRQQRIMELLTEFRAGRLPFIEADDVPLLLGEVDSLQQTVVELSDSEVGDLRRALTAATEPPPVGRHAARSFWDRWYPEIGVAFLALVLCAGVVLSLWWRP